jgi:hypothetical protein
MAKASAKARKIQRAAPQSNGDELLEVSAMLCDSAISVRSKVSAGSRSSARRASRSCWISSMRVCSSRNASWSVGSSVPDSSTTPAMASSASACTSAAMASLASRTPSWCRKARATMPTSIRAEPNMVKMKNLRAA